MKNTILFIGFLFTLMTGQGQNLLKNPSFEEPITCPLTQYNISGFGTIQYATSWFSPSKSSDYYTPCYNLLFPTLGAPANFRGFQTAKEGTSYAGIYLLDKTTDTVYKFIYREYLEGTLLSPLQKDSVYRVQFYIAGPKKTSACNAKTDRIGAYLHKDFFEPTVIPYGEPSLINAQPQIENPLGRFLYDTLNWMPVCGYFKATGGESFITIGNFYDNQQTALVNISADTFISHSAYCYVDAVSVELVPAAQSPYLWTERQVICFPDLVTPLNLPASLTDIHWSTGDTTHSVAVTGAGTYWVRAALDGCIFTDTLQIDYTPAPVFGFPQDTLAVCNTLLPLNLAVSDCCADVLWSTSDTTKATLIQQEGLVWVAEQNACGSVRDSFWLHVDDPQSPDLGLDTAWCDTLPLLRVLQGPQDQPVYEWSTGETSRQIVVMEPGMYWLEVQNQCGSFADTVVFKDLHTVRLSTTPDSTLCLVEPFLLTASEDFDTYVWNTGQQDRQIQVEEYGQYIVTALNACGTQTDTVLITERNHPTVTLPAELVIDLGDSIQFMPLVLHDKPVTFQWSPVYNLNCDTCKSPVAFPWQSTDFSLVVSDSLHCREEARVHVQVIERQRIYIPNVFSPNADGQNDLLSLSLGSEVAQILSLAIYDRWGSLVVLQQDVPAFSTLMVWDGRYQGRDAAPGIYTLIVSIRLQNGTIVRKGSDVTLLR